MGFYLSVCLCITYMLGDLCPPKPWNWSDRHLGATTWVNLSSLEEQPMLLTSGPSLQLLGIIFNQHRWSFVSKSLGSLRCSSQNIYCEKPRLGAGQATIQCKICLRQRDQREKKGLLTWGKHGGHFHGTGRGLKKK